MPRTARVWLPLALLAALISVVGWMGWNWCGWGYVAANRALLDSLPKPPGVVRIWVDSHPYGADEMAVTPPEGWGTLAIYQAPEGTTREDVVLFYIQELSPDWESCVDTVTMFGRGARGESVNTMGNVIFGKGTAYVSINTLHMRSIDPQGVINLAPRDTYNIYVDHDHSRELTCYMEYPLPILPQKDASPDS